MEWNKLLNKNKSFFNLSIDTKTFFENHDKNINLLGDL